MSRRWCVVILLAFAAVANVAAQPTSAAARVTPLSAAERDAVKRRLLSLLRDTDIADSETLYEAQQEGMALADALFTYGSPADEREVLLAAQAFVTKLPTAGSLAGDSVIDQQLARLELLSRFFSRARQRFGALKFSVDGLPLAPGVARTRRVFPTVLNGKIDVLSEVELQNVYLLSTMVREAVERKRAPTESLDAESHAALDTLVVFLMHDKVRFYWDEVPAWHWSGPFKNMKERVDEKLAATTTRVTKPPWFGAMVDHELHLFGVAADLRAALRADPSLGKNIDATDTRILGEVGAATNLMLARRVTAGADGRGFLIDYGLWTSNPSYAYAGCATRDPAPSQPCVIPAVATDASHARRWPWWLRSFRRAAGVGTAEANAMSTLEKRLAHQVATAVLFDSTGRPLMRNYMDGRDGWYRYHESPSHPDGFGPSSLSGALRYGAWALLAPYEPRIADAQRRFCAMLVSTDPADVQWRTRFYGSPSNDPKLAGFGDKDLYGPGSLYALTCRIGAAFGLY